MKKVIVAGGGAAGMMAAGRAAELGCEVALIEKNNILGKKLLITGKGRCNLTNASPPDKIIENICENPSFMYSSVNNFDSFALMDFFAELGLETKVERGNRVFPISDSARDVVFALERYLKKTGVKVITGTPVKSIIIREGKTAGVSLPSGEAVCEALIVATGGLSYPLTGSTGDGYGIAREAGHSVTRLYPSLVPLIAEEGWAAELQGLSLKNIGIGLYDGENLLYKDFGELIFTHFGVSGPVVLSASRYALGKYGKNCRLIIDLKPALSEEQLDARILRDFSKAKNKAFKNSLAELLPMKLIPVIVGLSGIPGDKKVNEIRREERRALARLMKGLNLTVTGARGFSEAVITVGGVSVSEINPKTMESKLIPGLYFCGEVLDVDAYTGGFNLQIAFSTGRAAGTYAAKN